VKNFGRIIVADFEYEVSDGDLPNPLCYVWYELNENLQFVRRGHLWRSELSPVPPHDIGPDTLYVAYSAWAEMTCFSVLGWKFPEHIFDQHTAYLAASNILQPMEEEDVVHKKQGKRLPDACRAYGIEGWERVDKETIAKDIGEGRWQIYGREAVVEYCEEDVTMSTKLLRAQLWRGNFLPPADPERVLFWSEYASKAASLIQARGMPIDMLLWNLVQEHKEVIIAELLRRFDPSHSTEAPVFDQYGKFEYARFAAWLVSIGIKYWPRTKEGRLRVDGDTFRLMQHIPGMMEISALKDSIRVISSASLPIGHDGRNRPRLFPFCTSTGRNAHSKSLFNAHAGMRSFMVAPPGKIMAYLDWRTQEIAVVAAASGDQGLIESYRGGDVYYTLAINAGLTTDPDRHHWKKTQTEQRQQMKSLNLAINYGMGVPSLARGLNKHPVVASKLIEDYKRSYPRLFEWRRAEVHRGMLERRMESPLGWPLHISHTPNQRTLYNFPAQSGGADMLRLAAVRLCEVGIVPSMLIHDGILIEVDSVEQVEHAKEIMRWAGRVICNDLEVGVDADQLLKPGERFSDKRDMAKEMWATIMDTLEAIGVWKRRVAS
jgi:hypothetical protein